MEREGKQSKITEYDVLIVGANTGARGHIKKHHYAEYHKACEEQGIEEHPEAIPPQILKERAAEAARDPAKQLKQTELAFKSSMRPQHFSKEGIIHQVAMHIVMDNQVSYLTT